MTKLYDVTVFTPNNGLYGCVGGYVASRLITANHEVEAERIALADEPAGASAYAKEVHEYGASIVSCSTREVSFQALASGAVAK
jgi:hypothetical protein